MNIRQKIQVEYEDTLAMKPKRGMQPEAYVRYTEGKIDALEWVLNLFEEEE